MTMKNLIFTGMLAILGVAAAQAQEGSVTFNFVNVEPSEVPPAVIQAQAEDFPGSTVDQWKRHEASTENHEGERYIAIFKIDDKYSRARYKPDGEGISYYTVYRPAQLPAPVTSYVESNYEGYRIMSANYIGSLVKDTAAFRISLRKGAMKAIIWLDEQGQLVEADSIPAEMAAEETE